VNNYNCLLQTLVVTSGDRGDIPYG